MFGLIFFPDRDKGFREMHRVLRPGGRAMARSSAPFVLLRRRIGEEEWARLGQSILERLIDRFGPGPLELDLKALVGVGVRG